MRLGFGLAQRGCSNRFWTHALPSPATQITFEQDVSETSSLALR